MNHTDTETLTARRRAMLGVIAHDDNYMTTDDAVLGFGVGDASWTALDTAVPEVSDL